MTPKPRRTANKRKTSLKTLLVNGPIKGLFVAIFILLFGAAGWAVVDQSSAASYGCPLNPGAILTSPHGWRNSTNTFHGGIDINAVTGAAVFAIEDGIAYHPRGGSVSGYGLYIDIKGSSGMWHRYAHLRGRSVSDGARVTRGQQIGTANSTGGNMRPHLHFEIRTRGVSAREADYTKSDKVNKTRIGGSDINPAPLLPSGCLSGGGGARGSSNPSSGTPVITKTIEVDCHKQILSRSRGSKGQCVEHLQYHLMNKGYSPQLGFDIDNPSKRPDGVFGPKTEDAVKYFQYLNGKTSSGCPVFIPNAPDRATRHRACDGIVGPKTWHEVHLGIPGADFYAVHATGPVSTTTTLGVGGDNETAANNPSKPPQPGTPGQPGASIGEGTGGTGGAGGTATGPNTVGGDGGDGGSGTCVGGCASGAPGASTPGTPGTSNPGTATQGSSGSSGLPGTQGSSGTSGGQGTQGQKGTSGSISIGGQSYDCEPGKKCTVKTSTSSSSSGSTTKATQPTTSSIGPKYVIRSHASGRCLDVKAGSSRGKDTQIWDCHGRSNQRWGFAKDGTIRVSDTGLCLDVAGGKTKDGTDVQVYTCNGGSHQRWQWNKDGTIRSAATGKCLDVKDNDLTNGTDIQIWDCVGGANQKWGTW